MTIDYLLNTVTTPSNVWPKTVDVLHKTLQSSPPPPPSDHVTTVTPTPPEWPATPEWPENPEPENQLGVVHPHLH